MFIYGYLLLALRRYLGLSLSSRSACWWRSRRSATPRLFWCPRGALNGSHAYLPAPALIAVAWPVRAERAGRLMFAAAGTLVVSLTLP